MSTNKFKVGNRVHPIDTKDPWEDICCEVVDILPTGIVVKNGRNEPDRLFREIELERVNDFVFKYTMKRISQDAEIRRKFITIVR